jgi:hypothetical protein
VSTGAAAFENTDPVVPPILNINWEPIMEGNTLIGKEQRLDGLDCRHCVFNSAHLLYGGGGFNLEAASFLGTTTIEYTGAAANTLAMEGLMRSIGIGQAATPPSAGQTIKRRTETKPAPKSTFDFRPPFVSGN